MDIPRQAPPEPKLPCCVCGEPTNCPAEMFDAIQVEQGVGEIAVLTMKIHVLCSTECAIVRMQTILALSG